MLSAQVVQSDSPARPAKRPRAPSAEEKPAAPKMAISSEEFDSSEAALQGLQDGTVDIMLECWNDNIAV